jgi:hypothetical protein
LKSIERSFAIENLTTSKAIGVVSWFIRTPLLPVIVENYCGREMVQFYYCESSRNNSGGSEISGSLSGD